MKILASILVIGISGLWPVVAADPHPPSTNHWAFHPILDPTPPAVQNTAWVRNPIDAFVLARLEKETIAPAPEADPITLARRLSFDLRGLPPSPEEVKAFLDDSNSGAYEALVDRFLNSPHFGEQWGRQWLDLARYADSDGYEKDTVRPWAWRYRDWVIRAINDDLPFDQFTIEQLAGDLLPNATTEQKVATGFHRNTLTNKEGGVDQEEFRCKAVVDRVSTTGTVWLGLTVGCAECHNHKYDPISQREFYELFAFFNNAEEKEIAAPRPEELLAYQQAMTQWEADHSALQAQLNDWTKQHASPAPQRGGTQTETSSVSATESDPDPDPEGARLQAALEKHAKQKPASPATQAPILSQASQPRATHIHLRGDFLQPGDEVHPATPSILPPLTKTHDEPTRLDLARWLVDPANPLTRRVTVNRIWSHLFGRGLVTTPDDFGRRGDPPSHPELLDWLASEFTHLGWSRKALIRLIVTSSAYRQSSRHRPELRARDPLNTLLARQNRYRLPAENVRDAHLAASGLLSRKVGGPGIHPPLPADIAALGYANSVKWKESEGEDRYRRGLYIHFQRTVPYPMLTTFDAPDSNVTCTRRERSNTPLQALTLLNDPVFFECAQALGKRVIAEAPEDSSGQWILAAFQHGLSRTPTYPERRRLRQLFREQKALLQESAEHVASLTGDANAPHALDTAALVAVSRILMNLDEFVTRE